MGGCTGRGTQVITLHYFASLKEQTGIQKEQVPLENIRVQELVAYVKNKYGLFQNATIHVAVNEEYALPDEIVNDGDIVAFLPPVSGG